ncbi:MAG: Rne/Rng family ribonuclease [Desulfuromonadia bacterium]
MPRKMLINAIHPEEARIAIIEEGKLVELEIEIAGSEQIKGNVYKGVVVRVEPSLQAAFVDIGLKKLGFLQMGEIHPDNWRWRDDVPEDQRKKRPRIQEVIRRGQELVVQVEKGERDTKGAALTTYISLPGRYIVLMPGSDSTGISRKIEGEGERKKLREMIEKLDMPEGVGYIVRTEAMGKTKTELAKDLVYQMKIYDEIKEKARTVEAPGLIYQETDLFSRTLRDYFTADIDEVLVDSPDALKRIKAFFKQTMPKFEKIVKLHQEKRPIFSRYQIEEQIDHIYEKKVPLPSGGSIVIEPTEALVSIDVNSGKSTGERGVEDTAYHTNLEAAEEIARQLRLRDLGGLIVIDFIDMRDKKHIREVELRLKESLKRDKARTQVGHISEFGILELSRQRIKQAIEQAVVLECPHCSGRGKVKSVESMALSFLRKVHAAAAKGNLSEVHGELPLEVAYYLLNRKKRELARIEDEYDIVVTIKGKPSFLMNQLELTTVKREKQKEEPLEEPGEKVVAESLPPSEEPPEEVSGSGTPGEPQKKKRRRGKKKPPADTVEPAEGSGEAAETVPEGELPEMEEPPADDEEERSSEESPAAEEKKKRKRRRRRKKKGETPQEIIEPSTGGEGDAPDEVVEPLPLPPSGEPTPSAPGIGEAKPKRSRSRKKGEITLPVPEPLPLPDQPPSASEEIPVEPAPAKPTRRRARKIPPAEALTPEGTVDAPPLQNEEKPKRRGRRKSVAAPPAAPDEG